MVTKRKVHSGIYTETKRVVDGEVRQVTCCCKDAGASRSECAIASGNKNPCRCFCHDDPHRTQLVRHKADKFNQKGGVSALCYKRPRSINLSQASWTLADSEVTCLKCRAIIEGNR